ncbi:MAG: alpha/beta fold hydrolase [Dehalococcoidia bacterium]|nr:alpha/beta fold hydrolase [Dehalococcoidia bacterium]
MLFDQRQCGRSAPHASDPATDLSTNTTWHLVADMEALRERLAIERWALFGQSWGTTLALAYAEQHPERIAGMVLGGVTTTTREEIHWLTEGVGRFFPEAWERFHVGAGSPPAGTDLAAAYRDLLASPDPAVREQAARDWCDWEMAIVDTTPGHRPHPRYEDPRFRMAFARIVTHYFAAGAWLEEGQLLRDAGRLAGIPGVLVHGRLDYSSPLRTAWKLAQAWPDAELTVVEPAGHDARDGGIAAALVTATDRLASRVRV